MLPSAPTASDILWWSEMRPDHHQCMRQTSHRDRRKCIASAGFTLLEVLVALVIVGTALGASLRAVGSLTQNSSDLRASMMATWSAENRLTQIRLIKDWPALGQRSFDPVLLRHLGVRGQLVEIGLDVELLVRALPQELDHR